MIKLQVKIPNNYAQYQEVVDAIEPIFGPYSAFFGVWDDFAGNCQHIYSVANTDYNQQLVTALVLKYPGIEAVVDENGVDDAEMDEFFGVDRE